MFFSCQTALSVCTFAIGLTDQIVHCRDDFGHFIGVDCKDEQCVARAFSGASCLLTRSGVVVIVHVEGQGQTFIEITRLRQCDGEHEFGEVN